MLPLRARRAGAFGFALLVVACSKAQPETPPAPVWELTQADPKLESGRQIWRDNCKRCHAFGIEGAPRIDDGAAWGARAGKGLDELTRSAISGVLGKAGGEMPPRGGNEALSDADLRLAVAFMVAAAKSTGSTKLEP